MHISTSWGYIFAIAIAVFLNGYARLTSNKISPVGDLFRFGFSHRISRFAFVFIWWWLGWHFLGSLQPI